MQHRPSAAAVQRHCCSITAEANLGGSTASVNLRNCWIWGRWEEISDREARGGEWNGHVISRAASPPAGSGGTEKFRIPVGPGLIALFA